MELTPADIHNLLVFLDRVQLTANGVICDYIKMNGDKYKPRMVNINGTDIYVLAKETA